LQRWISGGVIIDVGITSENLVVLFGRQFGDAFGGDFGLRTVHGGRVDDDESRNYDQQD
jgi:hypothetical protein